MSTIIPNSIQIQRMGEEALPAFLVRGDPLVSIIVPTLNEAENIDPLLAAIFDEAIYGFEFEILIADGGSTDGTVERVNDWEKRADVRLVAGGGSRGLAGDVLAAARVARSDVVVVMDADFSHAPSSIHALVQPVLNGEADMVVGSRYVPGGATPGWPLPRRMLSRLGGLIAWPLTEIKDPMSGFFAVRRERLLAVDPEAAGFKIALEVMAHGGGALDVIEVPISFPDRVHGESKIGKAQMVAYLRRLLVLGGGAISAGGAARFAAVGFIGMFVDLLVFQALIAVGAGLVAAHVLSFCVATVSNYCLNSRWAFAGWKASGERASEVYLRYLVICLLALAMRGSVLAGASRLFDMPAQWAIIFAIGAAAVVSYLGSAFFVFPSVNPRVPYDIRWRVAAIGVVGYAVLLRFLFIGVIDVIPQEAYYWNYSQHLDIGYLDHPPMVAWLIRAGTSIFGNNEFGVRIAALACWFATAFFTFSLSRRLFGKSVAFVSLLLVAAMPFYFGIGLLMTPDAPLTAAWAGSLYFLERALLGGQRRAWWGAGIFIGLGMLSKYTIALLGPATLIFMLVDVRARGWLKRPEPYLAAALALLVFSPVIYWNIENGLASFAFQSTGRMADKFRFALPSLILNATVLLTPPGLVAAIIALWHRHSLTSRAPRHSALRRLTLFMTIFTLAPLSVFMGFSLLYSTKLNWTGPLWLAALPAVSMMMLAIAEASSNFALRMRRVWVSTVAIALVFYGVGLNYLVLGLPGVDYAVKLPNLPVAWSEFGREAASIQRDVRQDTGAEPIMIALDKYNLASELAFYGGIDGNGVSSSVGRGVLGEDSLMYDYWFKPEAFEGRPAILLASKRGQIENPDLAGHFSTLSEPMERVVLKDGKLAGRFYYRIGYDFQAK
ncbi:glycosyltransferase family 39 protein [Phyllobacterium leguminum]|uniref:Dolichol-phosphate mannosyltransferase n=1 Tax=Phyllobacterium leguminum TaxID=314237 RepID=A0A318SX72_9HYPH|nr:glycosyltransferase family 39 protein [Phyllobacterium leguminum]PYE86586.1 dolichol-phosphate mannosyltransferase [Phyllobacterium leguminum]